MRFFLVPAMAALSLAMLAGCDRPGPASSTTVVKEPATVQKEKERDVVREAPPANSSSTTIVQPAPSEPSASTTVVEPSAPAPGSSTRVNVDTGKPQATTEKSRSTSTTRVDTPAGSATRTETDTSTTR